MKDMEEFDGVTKMLQKMDLSLADARALFDAVIRKFPTMGHYLSENSDIIKSKEFENSVVKLINNPESLSADEKSILSKFKISQESALEDDSENLSLAENAVLESRKRRKVSVREFEDLSYIAPTSNIVERLFSKARLVLTDYRKSMTPYSFECLMFLGCNRGVWDLSTVATVLSDEKGGNQQ